MKPIRILYLSLLIACLPLGLSCKSSLQPGGAYAPTNSVGVVSTDMPLFVADAAYQLAWNGINTVFTAEKNNRDLLWKVDKNIKHTLDEWRPKAVAANKAYLVARGVYIANPVPDNLTGVQAALAELQRIFTAVQSVLPKQ